MRSSQRGFAPATLAMTAFVWPNTQLTLRFIDEATKLGHKGALAVRCGFFRTGRFGIVRKIIGYALTPFARLRFTIALWINPFSDQTLQFISTDPRPAFRTCPRSWNRPRGVRTPRCNCMCIEAEMPLHVVLIARPPRESVQYPRKGTAGFDPKPMAAGHLRCREVDGRNMGSGSILGSGAS